MWHDVIAIKKKDQLNINTTAPGATPIPPIRPRSMDHLVAYLPPSLHSIVEPYGTQIPPEHAQLIGVALVSLAAAYVGYLYVLSQREAAVTFNVPLPAEVRKSGEGKKWDEVQGQEKRVLEDQARGVSDTRLVVLLRWQAVEVLNKG